MNNPTDQQLLRDFAARRSDAAFAELVQRHVDLVYSAALRMVCDAHLAEDVTQSAFAALAQNARQLADHPVLSGWLHRTAQNLAANAVRSEVRRRAREQEAATMNQLLANESDANWENIAPHLDAALGELNEADRDAVLLRYFEKKSAAEMAQILGITDDTAQKRVSRAVERLREFFSKRKITIGASGLAVVISANAVQSAPIGLAATISAAAVLTGTAVHTSTLIAATKTIAMTTIQKSLIVATLAVVAGAGIYEAKQAKNARAEMQTLQQQQAEQNQKLQNDFADATSRLANLLAENARLKSNPHEAELLKLRGEVTRLRMDAEQADDLMVKKALRWKANVEKMKLLFAEHPEQQVPEMKLLSDDYFFDLARDQDLESTNGIRKAFSEIRERAKNIFAPMLEQALSKFSLAHDGQLPSAIGDLKLYFENPVDDSLLDQYDLIVKGSMGGDFVIKSKQVIDSEYDRMWGVGLDGYGPLPSERETEIFRKMIQTINPAIDSFRAANGGNLPKNAGELEPYITTPEQQSAFDELNSHGLGFSPSKK